MNAKRGSQALENTKSDIAGAIRVITLLLNHHVSNLAHQQSGNQVNCKRGLDGDLTRFITRVETAL